MRRCMPHKDLGRANSPGESAIVSGPSATSTEMHCSARARWDGLILLGLGAILFLVVGVSWERISTLSMGDFKVAYYSARCLIQNGDPYDGNAVERVYHVEGREDPKAPVRNLLVMTRYFYLPSAFIVTVPFALLGFNAGHLLWMAFSAAGLILAGFLMWEISAQYAPVLSGALIGFVLANCLWIFMIGNSAAIAISLCTIGVWCFLRNRFVAAGILCLALSLVLKPHDSGFVWLYFLVAGGVYRKRALQTFVATCLLSLPGILWVQYVSPHWMQEMRSNMSLFSTQADDSTHGTVSIAGGSTDSLVELQSVFDIFWNNPALSSAITYALCGALLAVWLVVTMKSPASLQSALLALATIAPLSMLPLYHWLHDTKLILLTIPACAMLWGIGGARGKLALLFSTGYVAVTADIPQTLLGFLTGRLSLSPDTALGKVQFAIFAHSASWVLLLASIFFLSVYTKDSLCSSASAMRIAPRCFPSKHI